MQGRLRFHGALVVAALTGAALVGAAAPAVAQTAVNCPEFVLTSTATPADPAQIAGFKPYMGGAMSAQSYLMDVAVYVGATQDGAGAPGKAEGARKLGWSFDGQSPVKVACLYEGGVTLAKPVGSPKACTASIKRSKEKDAGGWGMESAAFSCR